MHLRKFKCIIWLSPIICYIYFHFRYAGEILANRTLPAHSRFGKWFGTNGNEIRLFLALIICIGIVTQVNIADYRTTVASISTPFFPSVMSRDRFLLLLTFLHLADNRLLLPRAHPDHNVPGRLGNVYVRILICLGILPSSISISGWTHGALAWQSFISCI